MWHDSTWRCAGMSRAFRRRPGRRLLWPKVCLVSVLTAVHQRTSRRRPCRRRSPGFLPTCLESDHTIDTRTRRAAATLLIKAAQVLFLSQFNRMGSNFSNDRAPPNSRERRTSSYWDHKALPLVQIEKPTDIKSAEAGRRSGWPPRLEGLRSNGRRCWWPPVTSTGRAPYDPPGSVGQIGPI